MKAAITPKNKISRKQTSKNRPHPLIFKLTFCSLPGCRLEVVCPGLCRAPPASTWGHRLWRRLYNKVNTTGCGSTGLDGWLCCAGIEMLLLIAELSSSSSHTIIRTAGGSAALGLMLLGRYQASAALPEAEPGSGERC